ncbi:MAG: hypothetical protein KF910_04285 [Brevundimonas sp.]|uniref:hypothetical protein n=1 Tax=Brevundimonas sp. TaxID=1871086 RepID=UPI0025C5AF96|nr:hypothetical protein [Brevundimonas sp.]MBX3476800.1 hypothetical protein [Brevundimonas sp.]
MSAKPKALLTDPYAGMDGSVVSQSLIDDLSSPQPSADALAWVERASGEVDAAPDVFRPMADVMAEMRNLIDQVEAKRGG